MEKENPELHVYSVLFVVCGVVKKKILTSLCEMHVQMFRFLVLVLDAKPQKHLSRVKMLEPLRIDYITT